MISSNADIASANNIMKLSAPVMMEKVMILYYLY